MPWWFWILLWVALAAVALLVVVLLGIRIFRGFMATMEELEAAGAKLERRRAAAEAAATAEAAGTGEAAARAGATGRNGGNPLPVPAVFVLPEQARAAYDDGRHRRREARRRRRIAWRRLRHQPRRLRDLRSL